MLGPAQRASGAPNQGISSPSLHGSGSSWTRHLQERKTGGERPQSLQRRAGMLCPLSNKRTWISNTSVSPGASGVLRPPAAQPYACLHLAYCGLFASYFWALRPTSCCGRDYSASYPVLMRGQYIKWAEPNYGASLGPDNYLEPRRRHPKTGLRNGFI